jgi:Spy/CpxP family protein refolding chaperone
MKNSQVIRKVAGMNKLSALLIMVLMTAAIFALFLLMSVGKAIADPLGRGMGPRFGQRAYDGDLTPEQKAKMEKARMDYWKETIPLRQELGAKRTELKLLKPNSKTESDRIERLRKDIQDLQEKIREKNFNYRCQCQDLLPPERRDSFSSSGPGRPGLNRGPGRGWGDR